MERVKKFREPITWVMLVVLVGAMVLAGVQMGWLVSSGTESVAKAAGVAAASIMNLTVTVLVVALVCLCLFAAPSVPRGPLLARIAAVCVSVGAVLTAVATVVGLTAMGGLSAVFAALGGLVDLVLKLVAAIVLWLIVRALSAGRLEPAPTQVVDQPAHVGPTDAAPPLWGAGQAAGTVWKTAAEAAAGARGAGLPARAVDEGSLLPGASDVEVPYTAGTAWAANPQTKAGAAEAMGWRRADAVSDEPKA